MSDHRQFTGYAYMSERTMRDGETLTYLDWESVRDTIDEAMTYAREWHDLDDFHDGLIVYVTATVEEVATLVDCEEPELVESIPGQKELFT